MIDATQNSRPASQGIVSSIKFNDLLGKAEPIEDLLGKAELIKQTELDEAGLNAWIIDSLRNAVEVIGDLDERALPNDNNYPLQLAAYVNDKDSMLVRDSDISSNELNRFESRLKLKHKDKLDIAELKELTKKIQRKLHDIITYNYVDRNIGKFRSRVETTERIMESIDKANKSPEQDLISLKERLDNDTSKLNYFQDLRDTAKDIDELAGWFDRTYPNLK
jgi:hypothetical protein